MKKMRFASSTTVHVSKSKAEIEHVLARYGADGFAFAQDRSKAMIEFTFDGARVRFVLPIPDRDLPRFQLPKHGRRSASDRSAEAHDQECRRLWRALALIIKAKLEAVDSGIVGFDHEFLGNLVLPGSRNTVASDLSAQLLRIRESGKNQPLMLTGDL